MTRFRWLIGTFLLALALSACGGTAGGNTSSDGNEGETQPRILGFTPSTFYPKIGSPVTFTWVVENPGHLPCDFDFNGDGIVDRTVADCPNTGSTEYSYQQAGETQASISLGVASDSVSITVESIRLSAFYWALTAIADCDAGLAGGGEFGWDLKINGTSVALVGPSEAVLLNDGETYYFSGAGKTFEISSTSESVQFQGVIYEYDSAGQLELYLAKTFGEDENWGVLPTGRFWRETWDVEPGCKVELLYAVRETP